MKQGIHPEYHKITVRKTNGDTFETYSTYGNTGDVLMLDIDDLTHPAWTGGGQGFINERAGKVAKFNQKFSGLGVGKKKSEDAA